MFDLLGGIMDRQHIADNEQVASKVGTFATRVRALTPLNVHRTFSGALFTLHPLQQLVLQRGER